MRGGVPICIALLTTAAAAPATAQSRVTTAVDTTHVTVGDRVTVTVTVEHASSSRVTWPDSFDLGPFEVLGESTTPDETRGDVTHSSLVLTLAAFELGELEIPSFEIAVTGADGTVEGLTTNPVGVEVASVGVDESGDIRDIRGPLDIPLGMIRRALWVLLPLLLVGILWVLARRLRSKESEPARPEGPLPRPPHELALEALAALERSQLLERGQVKEYHIEASDILRTYAEARFGVDALEMTTHEVLVALERAGADARFRDGLGAFLSQCDLVKFAKVRPGLDASRQVLDLGRRIVLDSLPAPRPAPEPLPGPGMAAPARSDAGPGAHATESA